MQLNPAGRPKGSRNKLGEDFVTALYGDFKEHGVSAIEKVRADDAATYIKVVASLLPKETQVEVNVTHHDARQRLGRKLHAIVESATAPEPPVVTH